MIQIASQSAHNIVRYLDVGEFIEHYLVLPTTTG